MSQSGVSHRGKQGRSEHLTNLINHTVTAHVALHDIVLGDTQRLLGIVEHAGELRRHVGREGRNHVHIDQLSHNRCGHIVKCDILVLQRLTRTVPPLLHSLIGRNNHHTGIIVQRVLLVVVDILVPSRVEAQQLIVRNHGLCVGTLVVIDILTIIT